MAQGYLSRPWPFKIRKVARYLRLYGPRRTVAKVRAQLHLGQDEGFSAARWINPGCRTPDHVERCVGIIGCGNFAFSSIAHHLKRQAPRFLRAACDSDPARARSLCESYAGHYASTVAEELLSDPAIRLIYVASNHASHADYAIRCLDAGKDVHVEKPQAVTAHQLERLVQAQEAHPEQLLFLGYNRSRSPHFQQIKEAFDGQPGPAMINWFIAGHRIPEDHWYFSKEEGGRVLGNICHWTDLTLALVGLDRAFPCSIVPLTRPGARSDFAFGIRFAEGSVAAFTFSAKGHTFEGVREVLHVHRDDALIRSHDCHATRIDIVEERRVFRTLFREHGHRLNILNSFRASRTRDGERAVDSRYNLATGQLVLAVREALESGREISLDPGFPPETHSDA